jgi:class 3 adenylate cyclase
MLAHSLVVFWQVHDALMRPDLPRGTVTFLFTDIEGSTRPLRRLGPELYAEALAAHRQLLRDAFAAEGGVEIDTQGDGLWGAIESNATSGPVRGWEDSRKEYEALVLRADGPPFAPGD